MSWPELVGVIGSVATVAGIGWKVVRIINDIYRAMTAVLAIATKAKQELEHNGGHSVKDSVVRTDDRTARLEEKLTGHIEHSKDALDGIQKHLERQDRRIDQVCVTLAKR